MPGGRPCLLPPHPSTLPGRRRGKADPATDHEDTEHHGHASLTAAALPQLGLVLLDQGDLAELQRRIRALKQHYAVEAAKMEEQAVLAGTSGASPSAAKGKQPPPSAGAGSKGMLSGKSDIFTGEADEQPTIHLLKLQVPRTAPLPHSPAPVLSRSSAPPPPVSGVSRLFLERTA